MQTRHILLTFDEEEGPVPVYNLTPHAVVIHPLGEGAPLTFPPHPSGPIRCTQKQSPPKVAFHDDGRTFKVTEAGSDFYTIDMGSLPELPEGPVYVLTSTVVADAMLTPKTKLEMAKATEGKSDKWTVLVPDGNPVTTKRDASGQILSVGGLIRKS